MLKIKSLNRDSISDDDLPVLRKEAREENALEKYNQALKYLRDKDLEDAEKLLQSLLDEDIPEIENRGGLPKTMSTLKYSCYLNIGTIAFRNGNKNKSLEYFLCASELDKTDVTLWYKIGNLAIEVDKFKQAAIAFSKGLDCNKNHWPTLDRLITLLFAMRDTISCLHYISHGLQLDPEYTRGLMLRKRIYEINPGTQEYYQIYNPDYIYDPPLNTVFDEAEGKELEKESSDIYERINVLEIELGPKPLPVLPLSKPLQEFTWLSLGQTILHMHHYISENKLSFISRIDLARNLSVKDEQEDNNNEIEEVEKNKLSPEESEVKNDDLSDENKEKSTLGDISDFNMSDIMEIDKDDFNKTIETCEEDNQEDMETNILTQTEDEEGKSEENEVKDGEKNYLSDKVESLPEEKKSKSSCRRRRNSLSFLQPWAWHSKRKSTKKMGKNDKDDTIEGCLRRLIPNSILPNGLKSDRCKKVSAQDNDDSLNTMDLYRLFFEEQEQTSDVPELPMVTEKKETDQYFGSEEENSEVEEFWKYPWERCDITLLLEKFVKTLSTKWNFKWPQKLITVYLEAYDLYRGHFDHPSIFGKSVTFETLKTDAQITLLYAELLFDAVQCYGSSKSVPQSSITLLELICTRKYDWGSEYLSMCLRLHWLKANVHMSEKNNDIAIRSLNSIVYLINTNNDSENYFLIHPNLSKNNVITLANTERVLKSLEMLRNISSLEILFENKNYEEVIKILKESFKLKVSTKYNTKIDRPVQIVMLLHALWFTDLTECFIWSEICLNESLPQYLKTHAQPDSSDHKRWSLVVVKCLVLMEACIKEDSIIIVDSIKETQTRFVENLASILCHQINSKSVDNNTKMPLESVKPWILLHYILQREEHRIQASRKTKHCLNSDESDEELCTPSTNKSEDSEEDEEADIPASVALLFSAHEFLGRRSWCLDSNGELLLFMVDVVLYRLNAPIFEAIRDKIDIHIEQAFFCLYQHPSKKNKVSRHLADHNVNPLSLNWDRAQQLYEFYQPRVLPNYDSYKASSITYEMEQLLLRIKETVPRDLEPQSLVVKVTEFVNGQSQNMPHPIKFPEKVASIYYLLGDYYLKHCQNKGLEYFIQDLCINPSRLDTWADMALATASQLETKLNHCESFKNESEFLDKARTAQICFKQSLQLSDGHGMLWIEYGNFVYMSHSYCSRVLKQDADTLSMEKFEILESQKEALLDTAMECFSAANLAWQAGDPGEPDERWLHHYMLGKISEKKKQDPSFYLEHYHKAAKLLFENNATYPIKINYCNPQNLSIEALEIHYRIHASILKYLELLEDKPITKSIGKIFQKYLKECDNGLFSKPVSKNDGDGSLKRPNTDADTTTIKRRRLSELTVFEDVASTLEDILHKVETGNLNPDENTEKTADVIMIIDSDEDAPKKGEVPPETVPPTEPTTKIRVKNVQEIMDDMMMKCMENQPEYKSETETDLEIEPEKVAEPTNTPAENPQKPTETCSSPSRRGSTTSTAATTTTSSTSDSSDSSSSDESSDSTSSSDTESSETESSKQSSSVTSKKNNDAAMSVEDVKKLIDQCLSSLEQCISRFPQNYKALYRLTHFYLNNKMYRDLNKCKQLMLSEYRCSDSSVVSGLFSDRKSTNFFNGVWRIPTSEIDRPGSFASHMSRCVQLLMQVLRNSNDHRTLLDLCLQLKKTPDPDKKYIKDSERQQLSDQALSLSIQTLRNLLKKLTTGQEIVLEFDPQTAQETDNTVKVLLEIFKAYNKVKNHLAHKEPIFSSMLIDAYKHYKQNKISEGVNVLDHAVRFCMQRKAANKIPLPPPTAPTVSKQVPQVPTTQQAPPQPVPAPPVRKTAKNLSGRPRGRPPNINKNLTGAKPNKNYKDNFMSSSNPYPWQNIFYPTLDPKLTLNVMMKYQEELMRQYSQVGQNQLLSNPNSFVNMLQSNMMTQSMPAMFNKDCNKNPMMPSTSITKDPKNVPSTSFSKEIGKSVQPKVSESKTKPATERKEATNDTKMRYSKESNKAYYVESNKEFGNDFFKDRPGISITPIHQNSPLPAPKPTQSKPQVIPINKPPVLPTTKPPNPMIPSSPGKTLQQKLAEKQKRNPAAQKPVMKPAKNDAIDMYNQSFPPKNIQFPKPPVPMSPPSIPKLPVRSHCYKNLAKNIPSSLTIMKTQPQNLMPALHTGDSGISISQVPAPLYKAETNKLMNFRKPTAPKLKLGPKLGSDLTVTPNYTNEFGVNIPLSLSVTKKDDTKTETKKEDAVEIITIE